MDWSVNIENECEFYVIGLLKALLTRQRKVCRRTFTHFAVCQLLPGFPRIPNMISLPFVSRKICVYMSLYAVFV